MTSRSPRSERTGPPGAPTRSGEIQGAPIRIGVSACLLGQEVRFDGGHKRDRFLTDQLGAHVEFVPVCPEVEAGMGLPREPVRLEAEGEGLRMRGVRSHTDHTQRMHRFAARRVRALAKLGLSGFVLKKDSPSCGMERVKVYASKGPARRGGRGLFAAALREGLPHLPVEEEGRLNDPRLRENFIERVFCYRRLRQLFGRRWTHGGLVAFHTAHKLLLLAHSPETYRTLGRLVADSSRRERAEVAREYEQGFMQGLARIATTRRHTNVLQHMLGHFKKTLDEDSRAELVDLIESYRRGLVPLVVPITLVRHHVRRVGVPYLDGQIYLDPHPRELMLRNHV